MLGTAKVCRAQELANVILVQVTGRIDHTTAKAFPNELLPLLNGCSGEDRKALLDLNDVARYEQRWFAGAHPSGEAMSETKRRNCHRRNCSRCCRRSLELPVSQRETVFKVFKTVREALEAISPAAALAYDRLS